VREAILARYQLERAQEQAAEERVAEAKALAKARLV
jgi:hypothetical protein